MEDATAQCLIISQQLVSSGSEQEISDKLKEIVHERNTQGIPSCRAIASQGFANISSICVGPQNIAVLRKDGQICRFTTQSKIHQIQPSTAAPAQGNNPGGPSQASNRNNLPKFRRVMLSATSFDRFRRGERVLIDRGRPMVPASSVPEDLIAQAQVVLQGKSREVIVRELQRTNLNVNEAVNNLLSRDDDEDDFADGGEVVLPEELLSLLSDSSGPHPIMEGGMYDGDFEYVLHRDMARRRAEKEKDKKIKDATPPVTAKSRWELDDNIEWWSIEGKGVPEGVRRFIMMTATSSELLAVSDTGLLYGWAWLTPNGDFYPHKYASALLPANDPIIQISSSRLRVMVLLKSGQIATWLDHYVMGDRVFLATEVKPSPVNLSPDEAVIQLIVSDHLAVARTNYNAFHWVGLYPANERPKMWEKEKNRSKKHVTFDTGFCDIKEGSEVRTKACPIYAAGSVALNFNLHVPMIGILMESVWTLTEMVRFRLLTPAEYDKDYPSPPEGSPSGQQEGSRKRKAQDEIFEHLSTKEEPWNVCDVIWLHEQQNQDVASVKIVDGAYVGVEYAAGKSDMTFASSLSGNICSKDTGMGNSGAKMRLMRKDELCLITPKTKNTRSPKVIQREPLKFVFNGASARKVLSAVAESTGIRALTEKRGKLYITRCSIDGKIHSEHLLPVYPPALFGPGGEPPSLMNYGEDGLLILVDGNGSVHPLARDATMGFREPQALNLPQVVHFGLFIEVGPPMLGKTSATRKMALVAMTGPKEEAADNEIPSLTQLIMFCDTQRIENVLTNYSETNEDVVRDQIVGERSDYGSNIIHTAIRLSVALKNRDDADPGTVHGMRLREDEIKMARDEARDLDQRWQRLIRANRSGEPPREEASVIQAAPMQDNAVQSPGDPARSQDVPVLERQDGVVVDPKERQKKSIEMVALILKHPAVQPYLYDLLTHRDYGGLTPFQAALNIRAYGAATLIWESIKELCFPPPDSGKEVFKLSTLVFPSGSRQDDNPIFLLCYNDTCSFTWTGEEHINQDIFECRTCGLTGSLCCCTECAYTCHRNHDCKLKRTSPTAYCDCWEKCPCKALIAGNQDKREALMKELVSKTNLYTLVNGKGEHLMLYLARTWGRQQTEQANSNKKRRQPATTHADPAAVPEHDLEPPKFTKFALETCLTQWLVVKSLIEVGCRHADTLPPCPEDVLCLNSQSGSTHLDKFVFILLSKCGDAFINQFLDCLVKFTKGEGERDDPNFHENIHRLCRSVLRIYIFLMLMSPTAAAVGIKGKNPYGPPVQERRIAAFSASGLFQIVRPSEHTKESKQHNLVNVILRCREILFRLCPYAVEQAAYFADSLLAPVRFGVIRPSVSIQLQSAHDPLDSLEKFLNSEMDLTSYLNRYDTEAKDRTQRKRKPSRREEHREEEEEQTRREYSEDSSDSEGDEPPSSRRYNSQSGNEPPPETTSSTRRKPAVVVYDDELTDPGSSSSDSDPSDDEPEAHVMVEDDVEDEDTEEDDHDERYGENSEGDDNQNYDNEGEEQRNDNDNDYPSPVYEPPSDEAEMNRDQEMAEIPPAAQEEDDNTRDAVHSEDSTNDNPEPVARDERNVSNDQEAASTNRSSNDRDIRRRHDTGVQRFSMSWTNRRPTANNVESEDDTDERNNSRAPPSTQNNTGAATSPSEQNRKSGNDCPPNVQTTYQQLSLGFDFTIRILCDLIVQLNSKAKRTPEAVSWNDEYANSIMQRISMALQYSWDYMSIVMDRLEAQIRFGSSILMSGVSDFRTKSKKTKDPKKDKNAEDSPPTNSKKETMEFFMATMRAYNNEAGDDYPLVDVDTLHHLVFLLDAYISFIEAVKSIKKNLAVYPEYILNKQNVHRFFQRSNSMCFPSSLLTDAWDTLDKVQGKIPYAEKPNLLTQEVEQSTLFAPPPENYSWNQFTNNCRQHGIPNIMDMNLGTLEQNVRQQFPLDQNIDPYQGVSLMEEMQPPTGMEKFTIEEVRAHLSNANDTFVDRSLARWKNIIHYMAKECHHEMVTAFGGEIHSNHILSMAGNFSIRQGIFRKAMDKFRGQQTKDISFDVHREPVQLIRDAVFQLNQTYVRRLNTPKSRDEPANTGTPLGSSRVKVRFFDEPGEGTGVARSFYTALAEALMNMKKFPFDNPGWEGEDFLYGSQNMCSNSQSSSRDRSGPLGRIAVIRDRSSMSAMVARAKRSTKHTRAPLSADSEVYNVEDLPGAIEKLNAGNFRADRTSDGLARKNPAVAEAIYAKVKQVRPAAAARITGMLVDAPVNIIVHILTSPDLFKQYIEDAVSILLSKGKPADLALLSDQNIKDFKHICDQNQPHPPTDDAPLFARTSRRGLYTPVPGKMSPMRLNAFRNVGRIIGLCLSQGELFPLKLSRHVLKYILNRPMRWLDLQFYDPFMWESLRQLMNHENNEEYYGSLDLTFSAQVTEEAPDGTTKLVTYPLKEGGADIPVTRENVVEYVYKFVELKLLGADHVQCYAAIRQGVSDVIQLDSLEGLTPEDLRLLLCGADNICITTLQAVTTFSDESHASSETLDKFKSWFWSVVEGLSSTEKQDLIFFWTGSPSLPTSPENLQPQPTVMIRPPDDIFLPTANTCISRLYVPLYSSKKLLRSKLQLAIKAKNFGFV